jgi:uncharacterized membrane protein YdbT with pleckstrin-like domain
MAEPPLTADERVAHLAGSDIFALLGLDDLRALAPLFDTVRYAPLQTISHQGDTDATLWLVAEGLVALEQADADGQTRTVRLLDYGNALGQHGVFAGLPRSTTAVAVDPTLLLHVDGPILWAALRALPGALDRLVLPDDVRERLLQTPAEDVVAGEVVVATYRRHWIALARGLILPILFCLLALPAAFMLAPAMPSAAAIGVLALLGVALPLATLVWAVLNWRMDYLMVTDRRLIHVDKMPLVSERRRELPLTRVQDVRVASPNLVARLLGFGLISVQTAGTGGTLTFTPVAEPESIRELVMGQVKQAEAASQQERQSHIAARVRAAIGQGPPAPTPAPAPGLQDRQTQRPGPLSALAKGLDYFVPRLRAEDGRTVTWRKHWWVLCRDSILWLIAAAVLGALSIAAMAGLVGLAGWLASLGWLVVLAGLGWQYANWRNDYYQLTDTDVVDVDQLPLGLYRERRQAALKQIQDIRYEVPNPLAVLLNYGNLLIETAGETGFLTFDYIHDPAAAQREIFERIEAQREKEKAKDRARREDEFARWIQQYHAISHGGGAP